MMTAKQAKKLFEKYNPASDIVRCPNGRAKMRKPLDIYAKAAVNLYGIIRRDEFVDIFNAQNEDQTTTDEIYTILLPNVLKSGWYGFYKEHIVHYAILRNFDYVDYLEHMQADKPRYIPPKEQFLQYEWEDFEDTNHWRNVRNFMWDTFGFSKATSDGFLEIKDFLTYSPDIKNISEILDKYNLVFDTKKQVQKLFDLLMLAQNNTRIWENKGYTPTELHNLLTKQQPKEPVVHQPKKVGPNQPCHCGSGIKYKKCCSPIETSGTAQLPYNDCVLFYETWYKLLDYVNHKLHVVDYEFDPIYPNFHDEILLSRIREKLWANPKLINDFLCSAHSLSNEEIQLLQSWEKHHLKGNFLIVKYEPEYAIFMRMDKGKASKLYAVKGMTTAVSKATYRQLPVMLETVLLPFGDKIIYDSYMNSYAISFGDGAREMFEKEYARTQAKRGIITQLCNT